MDVLVVESDRLLARRIARMLGESGHHVDLEGDGVAGLARAEHGDYDIAILGVPLAGLDGVQICRELRRQGSRTLLLLLATGDIVPSRIRVLDAGADDYLAGPLAPEELLARVRALGRRIYRRDGETLQSGDLVLDLAACEARRGDTSIALTAREFDLLRYLLRHKGRVLTKAQITDHIWGYDTEIASNVAEIYIHYLRKKLDRGRPRPLIHTVRGVGYTIKE